MAEVSKITDEKLKALLTEARKKKNVLEDREIRAAFNGNLSDEDYDKAAEYLEKNGVDILEIDEEEDEDLEDTSNLDDLDEYEDDEEEQTDEEDVSRDAVKTYLKEIGRYDLLSPEEETELARQIEEAPDEETRKALKERMVNANLKLVVHIARSFNSHSMQLLDLIQEGNLGLIKAVDKFDYHRGYKFSTYATWWIKQAISRAIADQSRTIRIPVHMVETINRMTRAQKQLAQELGREPTDKEIADRLGVTEDRVEEIRQISLEPVSLESPVGEEGDSHLGDFIEDENIAVPVEAAAYSQLKEQLSEVLNELTDRERRVIELRYGLIDGREHTLEEVGKEFNVTRERVRQIEAKAIRKLRHPSRSRKLKDYLDE